MESTSQEVWAQVLAHSITCSRHWFNITKRDRQQAFKQLIFIADKVKSRRTRKPKHTMNFTRLICLHKSQKFQDEDLANLLSCFHIGWNLIKITLLVSFSHIDTSNFITFSQVCAANSAYLCSYHLSQPISCRLLTLSHLYQPVHR